MRRRYSVYRSAAPGRRIQWLVLDGLESCAIATCDSRTKASRVRDALNKEEAS